MSVDRQARPDIDANEASLLGLALVGAAMLQSSEASATEMSHHQWLDAHTKRVEIRGKWARFFDNYDAILMPISFVPPFEHDQEGDFSTRTLICNGESRPYLDLIRWTILTGMAYLPASVPPLGLGKSGLPIGFQVVGPYGADYTTIQLAGHIADLCGGFKPAPDQRVSD